MALDTYSGLVESVGAWLGKGTTLDTRIPDFIRLTESRLNKVLDDPDMEVAATITLTSGVGALPADYGTIVSVNNGVYGRLDPVSSAQFSAYSGVAGNPAVYAIQDGEFVTAPAGSGSVSIIYRRRIPALTADAPTNWLLDLSPEAYLYGCLLQAEFFGWNDERLPTVKAFYDDAVATLETDAAKRKYGGAPLAPRIGRA